MRGSGLSRGGYSTPTVVVAVLCVLLGGGAAAAAVTTVVNSYGPADSIARQDGLRDPLPPEIVLTYGG